MLKMNYYKQRASEPYCVPYSIKALADYFLDDPPSKKSILKSCKTSKKTGTFRQDAMDVMKDLGIKLSPVSTVGQLKRFIKQKKPIIISYSDSMESSHMAIIKGLRKIRRAEYVILHDPFYGENFKIPVDMLMILIKDAEGVFHAASRRGRK